MAMRPDASHDPPVELVEELADVSSTVVLPPSANDRVDLFDQRLRRHRRFATRPLADLILEVSDGLLAGVRIRHVTFAARPPHLRRRAPDDIGLRVS